MKFYKVTANFVYYAWAEDEYDAEYFLREAITDNLPDAEVTEVNKEDYIEWTSDSYVYTDENDMTIAECLATL